MKKKAFTLIELVVVLAIMGIIMAISIPSVRESYKKREQDELKAHIEMVNKSVRQYYALEGGYPEKIEDIVTKKYGVVLDKGKYVYTLDTTHNTVEVRLNK